MCVFRVFQLQQLGSRLFLSMFFQSPFPATSNQDMNTKTMPQGVLNPRNNYGDGTNKNLIRKECWTPDGNQGH